MSNNKLRKVEKNIVIPRYLEYKINHELCNAESKEFADCAQAKGLKVVIDCRPVLAKFQECSNKYYNDKALREQVEKEYLEKRAHFRKTGQPAEKSPFKRL